MTEQKSTKRAGAQTDAERLEQASVGTGERADSLKEANEKGFFGEKVDPTPNEHYTAPDPHTDPPKFTGPDVS